MKNYVHFVQLKGLQDRSVKFYLGWIKQLAVHFNHPDLRKLTSAQILAFLNHLLKQRKLAGSTVNQAVCALRTFYRDHLKKRWKIWASIKIKCEEALPTVLTRAEVSLLLKKDETVTCHTLRHSYATHLLEAGAHVRQVSAYLGHTTLKPTMVYLHLTEVSDQQARQALR